MHNEAIHQPQKTSQPLNNMPAATKKETYDDLLDMVDFESDNENGHNNNNKGNNNNPSA